MTLLSKLTSFHQKKKNVVREVYAFISTRYMKLSFMRIKCSFFFFQVVISYYGLTIKMTQNYHLYFPITIYPKFMVP